MDDRINSFDANARQEALIAFANASTKLNMHCHSFFSYNGYGYSPSALAQIARANSWRAIGMVDFDVLDGVDEFFKACRLLRIPAIAGMETRVFIPELASVEINSPGEPGVAYHLGYGFKSTQLSANASLFAAELRKKANERTANVVHLVNGFLPEIAVDMTSIAKQYTPMGNVTERHCCLAYRLQAEKVFSDEEQRQQYWTDKIGGYEADPVKMEALIRSKTMKKGGAGYIQAKPESFPTLQQMNSFVKECGARPTIAWLNGLADGEKDPEKLLNLHVKYGAEAVTLIPDRNWNVKDVSKKQQLLQALDLFVSAAEKMNLPILAGTEMNAPGQKLVDDFFVPELKPYAQYFIESADRFVNNN